MKHGFTTTVLLALFFSINSVLLTLPLRADEGMWTFDNPPAKQLKDKYHFAITQVWLDHVRLSSVRFNDGGSGSFISPNGLVLTNHHVALGQLQKISTQEKDYVADGFYAKTETEELKCPDLELNVLMSMENVTSQILGAAKPAMAPKEAFDARKAAIAKITEESLKKTGLRSDVIPLYQGSEYWLYRYKKYTDIRLVMAPEQQIAFFGGDDDNFTYPRYDLDMAFFRVYENGKPVHSENYLKWNSAGANDGDLVFVSGNPGSTDRLQTMAQLEFLRDVSYPFRFKRFDRLVAMLKRYSQLGPEQARRAMVRIFGINNALKAWGGEYKGLLDTALIAKRQEGENAFRDKVNSNPEWKNEYGSAWDSIAAAIERSKSTFKQANYRNLPGRLAGIATTIVEYVEEIKKPDGERLPQFQDAKLPSLKFYLLSPAPVYSDLEEYSLADGLQESLEELGPNDPWMQTVLGNKAPQEVAKELIAGTKLADPKFRKELIEGGKAAVNASTDPLIVLARKIDPMARTMQQWREINVTSAIDQASELIGKARFAVYGKTVYPDATFTLRLSYGTMKGYPMNGTIAPAKTTMYGLFDRALSFNNEGEFALPKRYFERKDQLNLATQINFVSTCDIIGGNSGSPTINEKGELIGVIFDGDIESLPGRFVYDETANRAVSVATGAMMECLRKIYDAKALADEIEEAGVHTASK
ncbi:MAG: S46 family peptidase [Bacteroidota bacterium]|nr:S46 family peptidase [Bacteroidota bacterium]